MDFLYLLSYSFAVPNPNLMGSEEFIPETSQNPLWCGTPACLWAYFGYFSPSCPPCAPLQLWPLSCCASWSHLQMVSAPKLFLQALSFRQLHPGLMERDVNAALIPSSTALLCLGELWDKTCSFYVPLLLCCTISVTITASHDPRRTKNDPHLHVLLGRFGGGLSLRRETCSSSSCTNSWTVLCLRFPQSLYSSSLGTQLQENICTEANNKTHLTYSSEPFKIPKVGGTFLSMVSPSIKSFTAMIFLLGWAL